MVREATYALSRKSRGSRLGQLLQWIDLNADAMLSDPDKALEAVGVGRKNADRLDASDADWCIVGFVKEKLSERELGPVANHRDGAAGRRSFARKAP